MSEAPTPKAPRRRRWRRALLVLVGLSLLVVLAVGGLLVISERRLSAVEQRIAAAGESLAVEDHLVPRPSAVADAAPRILPLLDQVAELDWEAEFLIGSGEIEGDAEAREHLPVAVAWIDAHASVVDGLHEALRRPGFGYEGDLSRGWVVEFDPIPKVQAIYRLLAGTTWRRIEGGSIEGAMATAADGLRLGTRLRLWPGLIYTFVGSGVQEGGFRCAANVLRAGAPSPAALDDLLAALDDAARAPDAAHVLGFHRAFTHLGYENLRSGKPVPGDLGAEGLLRGTPLGDVMSGWYFRFDQARFLERSTEAIALAGQPYAAAREAWEAFGTSLEEPPWYGLLSQQNLVLTPAVARVLARVQARFAILRLAVRVERAAGVDGAFPATLKLAGIKAPGDPLGEQSLGYRPLEAGGYLIYSVGEDGIDDGGLAEDDAPDGSTHDLVLRIERTR